MAQSPRRLSALALLIIGAGIALTIALAFAAGMELAVVFYVAPIVLLGAVAVGVAVKTRGGMVRPAECSECGGLISPNAPYCKHCGAVRD